MVIVQYVCLILNTCIQCSGPIAQHPRFDAASVESPTASNLEPISIVPSMCVYTSGAYTFVVVGSHQCQFELELLFSISGVIDDKLCLTTSVS